MLSMPILKFEKSTNYLNEQLNIQLNNKKLISDIISNINLILDKASDDEKENYLTIQTSANLFLQTISQNITTIEELNREIKHITYDLTEVLTETNKKEKSKEYYIVAIKSVKTNIENYTSKFQDFEQKLEQNNIEFNDFINSNNFKYNFTSNQNNDSYEFSGFSIQDSNTEVLSINENNLVEEKNSDEAIENVEKSTEIAEEPVKEKIDEKVLENNNSKEDSSDIVIDYESIYGNYYRNSKSIEENILSEYSVFDSSTTSSNDISTNSKPLFLLKKEPEEIVEESETPSNDLEENKDIEENNELNDEEVIDNKSNTNNDIELTDEDILEEILKEESVFEDTSSADEESLNDITLDDILEFENLNSEKEVIEERPVKEVKIAEPQIKSKPKKINTIFSDYNLEEKIKSISEGRSNNDTLVISEKKNKVYLPYTIDELEKYLKIYPEVYNSIVDVIDQEFILPFRDFFRFPVQARFSETYNLIRNRQGKSVIYSIMYGLKLLFKSNLNPAIIAACKTEEQLEDYLHCLNLNKLDKFKDFKIIYDVNLL